MSQKLINLKKLKTTRRSLRKRQTKPEVLIWSRLKNRQTGYKFRRQHSIGPFIVDFYCPQFRLVVEIDGSIHSKKVLKDNEREKYLLDKNFYVVRFSAYKVLDDFESVVEEIKIVCERLSTSPNPSLSKEGDRIR